MNYDEKPDVSRPGHVNDMIDEYFLSQLKKTARDDRVKEAATARQVMTEVLGSGSADRAGKILKKRLMQAQMAGGAKALVGAGALTGAGVLGHQIAKKRMEKQSGVTENVDNKKLIAKVRAMAAQKLTSDV